MAIEPWVVEMLVCPETRARVAPATPELLAKLKSAADKGTLLTRGGKKLTRLDGALVRQDQEVAYPVVDGIPAMLVDEQIALRNLR